MDILIKSILGGFTIGMVLLSARFLTPSISGLLTAIPVIFIFSFFAGFYSQSELIQQHYLLSVFISASLTAGMIGLLFLLCKIYPENINFNLGISFGAYLIAIFAYKSFN